jgi:hypothetical protein
MLDQDNRFPFEVDTTELRFFSSHECLGRLLGVIMQESRLVYDRPSATKVMIKVRAFRNPVGLNGYALVLAGCTYLHGAKTMGTTNIYAAYNPSEGSVYPKAGENLDRLIEEAEAWVGSDGGTAGAAGTPSARPSPRMSAHRHGRGD